jgi:alcohol dehydrogenase class IV
MVPDFGRNALIVTGRRSARECGALNDMTSALDRESVAWSVYEDIRPNPTIANVREAAQMARKTGADMIVGIGGGSPMDAAKAVAVLAANDLNDESMFKGPYPVVPLPVIAVPTTAGTGSEVTPYSIITDEKDQTKKNLSHPSLFPKLAFLDAAYTEKLPWETTVNTAMDALSHSIESILSKRSDAMSRMVALESLRYLTPGIGLMDSERGIGIEIREALLLGSMLGGMAIAQTGTTVVHAMGYSLTFFNDVDHGKANGLLLAEYLAYVAPHNTEKIVDILSAMGLETLGDLQKIIRSRVNAPPVLSDEDIALYTEKALMAKSVDNTYPRPTGEEIGRASCRERVS